MCQIHCVCWIVLYYAAGFLFMTGDLMLPMSLLGCYIVSACGKYFVSLQCFVFCSHMICELAVHILFVFQADSLLMWIHAHMFDTYSRKGASAVSILFQLQYVKGFCSFLCSRAAWIFFFFLKIILHLHHHRHIYWNMEQFEVFTYGSANKWSILI